MKIWVKLFQPRIGNCLKRVDSGRVRKYKWFEGIYTMKRSR